MKKYFIGIILCLFSLNTFAVAQTSGDDDQAAKYNRLIWDGKEKNWFEWWYVKVVVPTAVPLQPESFYITYGVVNPSDTNNQTGHASSFVSFGDFSTLKNSSEEFKLNEFKAAKDLVDVKIGNNTFNGNRITGQVKENKFDFSIQNNWSFNAMGWGMFVKNLTNIGWFPAQADARCTGTIESAGKLIQFTDAPCYQDRNWGKSFPKWWTWIVANNFIEDNTAALAIGGGYPKILGREVYKGVSVGFRFKNKEYTYRPNDLNHLSSNICYGKWEVTAENSNSKIEISAFAPESKFLDLPFNTPEGIVFHDMETLTGQLNVKFYLRNFKAAAFELVAELNSEEAGIEFGSEKPNPFSKNCTPPAL